MSMRRTTRESIRTETGSRGGGERTFPTATCVCLCPPTCLALNSNRNPVLGNDRACIYYISLSRVRPAVRTTRVSVRMPDRQPAQNCRKKYGSVRYGSDVESFGLIWMRRR